MGIHSDLSAQVSAAGSFGAFLVAVALFIERRVAVRRVRIETAKKELQARKDAEAKDLRDKAEAEAQIRQQTSVLLDKLGGRIETLGTELTKHTDDDRRQFSRGTERMDEMQDGIGAIGREVAELRGEVGAKLDHIAAAVKNGADGAKPPAEAKAAAARPGGRRPRSSGPAHEEKSS